MKYRVFCFECQKNDQEIEACFMDVQFRDDGVYLTTCPQRHEIKMILQNEHFEILLNLGMNAFLEGYFREAVVVLIPSEKLWNPAPFSRSVSISSIKCPKERPNRSSFHTTKTSPLLICFNARSKPSRLVLFPLTPLSVTILLQPAFFRASR